VCLANDDGEIVAILTDGDIRRSLLKGTALSEPALPFSTRDFRYIEEGSSRERLLKSLDGKHIKFMPVLKNKRLQSIIFPGDLGYLGHSGQVVRAKAPARVSFGGGGTDLTNFFALHGGAVLNATINMYAHVSLKKLAGPEVRILSLDYGVTIEEPNVESLKLDGRLDLIVAAIKLLRPEFGFEISVRCDFPPNSGLGGSSVVIAAVAGAFNELRTDKLSPYDIAELAFQCERIDLRNPGGWQDQYASVFGGFNFMEFSSESNDINPIRVPEHVLAELEERSILCYSGKPHPIASIHDAQKKNMVDDKRITEFGKKMRDLAYRLKSSLLRGDVDTFGEIIDQAWQTKKNLAAGISTEFLDEVYHYAKANGAIGGKILGAGGGGYFLFMCEKSSRNRLISALKERSFIVNNFEFVHHGVISWKVPEKSTDEGRIKL
jgi:D-glycero-alpha-D-manno-heptose-7-phosphate kinase